MQMVFKNWKGGIFINREFFVILTGLFIVFYYLIFYFVSIKFGDKIKLKHWLFIILGSVVVFFSYTFYFNNFIENELTHQILEKNFGGLFVASFGFAFINKKLNK